MRNWFAECVVWWGILALRICCFIVGPKQFNRIMCVRFDNDTPKFRRVR